MHGGGGLLQYSGFVNAVISLAISTSRIWLSRRSCSGRGIEFGYLVVEPFLHPEPSVSSLRRNLMMEVVTR
jgi:hypothetical protein